MIQNYTMDVLQRRNARTAALLADKRNFAAASSSRLTADWRADGISLDSILNGDLPALRARCRTLTKEEAFGKKFLGLVLFNVIGPNGMTLKNKAAEPRKFVKGEIQPGELDKLANTLIEDAWLEWGKKENCTTAKNLTWTQVQALAIREWATCGETLWEMVTGAAAGNKFNFALRPISIERLHHQSNYMLANGNSVRMGVEKNPDGRVVAYWLTDTDPTDLLFNQRQNAFSPRRYDASRFVHPFLMEEIGQSRGYPWAAAAMLRMKMLAGFDEATLVGARAAACKMAFLTKTGTGAEYKGPADGTGGIHMDAEPGSVEELPEGVGVDVIDWKQPSSEYDPFTRACLRGIAAGLMVSYPTLANDYGEVNFSAGRMAKDEEIQFWMFVQSCVAADFHEPIFAEWLEKALMSSSITYPNSEKTLPLSKYEKFNQPIFHGRRWGPIDPIKEINAQEAQLANGLTSPTRLLAQQGLDEDEVIEETAAYLEKLKAKGLPLPRWAQPVNAPSEPDMDEPDKKESVPATNGNGRLHLT